MAQLDPTAITLAAGEEPFTLQPLIKEMFETRRCIGGSVFIVEGIDVLSIPEDETLRAMRLLLGDGDLCIQALLHPGMFHLTDSKDVFVGCYVRVNDFVIRFDETVGDPDGVEAEGNAMVYLIVNELEPIGWNETYTAMWRRHLKGKDSAERPDTGQGKISTNDDETHQHGNSQPEVKDIAKESAESEFRARVPLPKRTPQKHKARGLSPRSGGMGHEDISDAFEAFESSMFPFRSPASPSRHKASPSHKAASGSVAEPSTPTRSKPTLPIALTKDWHDHQTPLRLTTLRSIPHLPYAQNWSVNILAILVSLSQVESSYLPPGKQRTARITDPSTAKHVHLTVFLDPDEFEPEVGSAVLLTGVKNHRFDGGSLKKYVSDGQGKGTKWWFEDPWEMKWLDVAGIKAWWADMQRYQSQKEEAEEEEITELMDDGS